MLLHQVHLHYYFAMASLNRICASKVSITVIGQIRTTLFEGKLSRPVGLAEAAMGIRSLKSRSIKYLKYRALHIGIRKYYLLLPCILTDLATATKQHGRNSADLAASLPCRFIACSDYLHTRSCKPLLTIVPTLVFKQPQTKKISGQTRGAGLGRSCDAAPLPLVSMGLVSHLCVSPRKI